MVYKIGNATSRGAGLYAPAGRLYTGQVRAAVDEAVGEVLLYVAIWGSPEERDAYDTWFDRSQPPRMDLDLLPFPLRYEHNFDEEVQYERVGTVVEVWFDEIGIAARALLNRSSPFYERILSEVIDGVLHTSSATAEHTAVFDSEGRFVEWSLIEVSLTRYPAEHRIPVVTLIRRLTEHFASQRGRDAPGSESEVAQSGDNIMSKFYLRNKDGDLVVAKNKQALQACFTGRALFNADGDELDVNEVLGELLRNGTTPQDLIDALQQLVEPADERSAPTDADEDDDEDANHLGEFQAAVTEAIANAFANLDTGRRAPQRREQQRRQPAPVDGDVLETLRGLINQLQNEPAERDEDDMNHPSQRNQPRPIRARITGVDRYAKMTGGAMALGIQLAESLGQSRNIPSDRLLSDEYMKVAAYKMLAETQGDSSQVEDAVLVRGMQPDMKPDEVYGADPRALRRFMVRTDEIMNPGNVDDGAGSTTSSAWVTTFHSRDVYRPIREEPSLITALTAKGMNEIAIPQGFNGVKLNLDQMDLTFFSNGPVADFDTGSGEILGTVAPSMVQTPTTEFTVAKLSAWAPFAAELVEDSIVDFSSLLQMRLKEQAPEQMLDVMINGHTATGANANYNLGDGTPAASSLVGDSFPAYMNLNGLVKFGLVDDSGIDAGNTITSGLYNNIFMLFPDVLIQEDRFIFLTDVKTGHTAKTLAQMTTQDVSQQATLENGMFDRIWGIDHAATTYMQRTLATGKQSATASNNVYGRIFCVRPDRLIWGTKRGASVSLTHNGRKDYYDLYVHMRWFFGELWDGQSTRAAYNVRAS